MTEPPVKDEMLDPLALLRARGDAQKRELLEEAGGVLSPNQVAERLGMSRTAVEQHRREGRLLAIPCDADHGYPACQFEAGTVVPALAEVLAEFGLERPWGALQFLLTSDERLHDLSPLSALKRRDSDLTAATIGLARGDAAADGFG